MRTLLALLTLWSIESASDTMAQRPSAFILSKCEMVTWIERPVMVKSHWIRTQVGTLLFEFKIEASNKVDSLPAVVFPIDSLPHFAGNKLTDHLDVTLFLQDDKGYIQYQCSFYDVFRFEEDERVFVQGVYGWEQDADYSLTPGALSPQPINATAPTIQVELVTHRQQANEFNFKVDVGTSIGPRLVKYRKGYGRVYIRYPSDDVEYELIEVDAVYP